MCFSFAVLPFLTLELNIVNIALGVVFIGLSSVVISTTYIPRLKGNEGRTPLLWGSTTTRSIASKRRETSSLDACYSTKPNY